MAGSYRRVVTGLSPEGRSTILSDEKVGVTILDKDRGFGACRLWATDRVPAKRDTAIPDASEPFPAEVVAPGGVSFCLFEYPPEGSGATPDILPDSDMVGYVVVVSGAVTYVTEDREVTLSAGDTIISRGVPHNVVNRGDVPAIMVAAIMDATSN